MTTTWGFSQEFLPKFQANCSALALLIQSATSSQPELWNEVAQLSKSLHDATGHLPSYDQRQCELTLKELEKSLEALQTATKPKPKFAFRRTAAPSKASPHVDAPTPVQNTPTNTTSNLTIASYQNRYLNISVLPTASLDRASDLSISDLQGCVVNLLAPLPHDFSAVHIRNLKDCLLLLPLIKGSILLHNLIHCTLVVGCHQLRMHDSKSVDVFLDSTSSPIIEHSSSIRFSKYPTQISHKPSQDFTVQDFSHIRPTPSPNWSMLPEDVEYAWPLESVADENVPDILTRVLPSD